jgi:hypothetical protein
MTIDSDPEKTYLTLSSVGGEKGKGCYVDFRLEGLNARVTIGASTQFSKMIIIEGSGFISRFNALDRTTEQKQDIDYFTLGNATVCYGSCDTNNGIAQNTKKGRLVFTQIR